MAIDVNKKVLLDFWMRNDEELLLRLKLCDVPVYTCESEAQRGINFRQVRYRAKSGEEKLKTRWLEDRPLKKKQIEVSSCTWTFMPVGIEPQKQSIEPADHVYSFLMNVRKVNHQGGTLSSQYSARIETAWDGTLLKQQVFDGNKDEPFPAKFAFPKRYVAKINHCLANNFFPDLWRGPNYAVWHRTDEGIAFYLGTRGYEIGPYANQLVSLLKSPYGDTCAILMAYTCFALLKSFFPQYPSLDKETPYIKAKKGIPEQLAINIRSNPPEIAERLADLCCGCFYLIRYGRVPVIDGVVVQKLPQKQTRLGIDEFEAKVLQPACVLWVNRIPAKELTESGRILDLQVNSVSGEVMIEPFAMDMVAALADGIYCTCCASYKSLRQANWESALPLMAEIQTKFLNAGNKYCFSFEDEEELKKRLTSENWEGGIAPDPIEYVRWLFQTLHTDVQREQYERVRDDDALLNLQSELKAISSEYQRKIQKCIVTNKVDKFSLQPRYMDALKFMSSRKYFSKVPPYALKKFAYLSAAFEAFSVRCLPHDRARWIMNKLYRALAVIAAQQTAGWSATAVMEEYIADAILTDQCARIRGVGSDRADIRTWYDPRDKCFFLPSKTYFDEVQSLIPDGSVSQRVYEQKLVDEGALQAVVRGKQMHRTLEIKVSTQARKAYFIKIKSQKFSDAFLSNPQIVPKLWAMDSDRSPYRAAGNSVS